MNEKMRQRFCALSGMPKNMVEEPYFQNRLRLYGKESAYLQFVKDVEASGGEDAFLELYNEIQDAAISFIRETKGYQRFTEENMNQFAVPDLKVSGHDIFKDQYVGHDIVSLDLTQANFHALRHYDEDMFGGAQTWKEFLLRFTDLECILNSKYFRQVIMGNCNPKRQTTYEKYLLYTFLAPELNKIYDNFKSFMHDEAIFDLSPGHSKTKEDLLEILLKIKENASIPMRLEHYTLWKIKGTKGYLKKGDGWHQIKGVSDLHYPFVFRKLVGEAMQEEDTYFIHDGYLSKMITYPQIEIIDRL